MEIDLAGAGVALEGDINPIAEAALAALLLNGGRVAEYASADVLLVSCPLRPQSPPADVRERLGSARQSATGMAGRGKGRIIFLLSAIAGMPMRRYPDFSTETAGLLAGMRTLAMEFGPKVLVNAVGFGLIEDKKLVAGDVAMLSHAPTGRPGTISEAVAAVLFLCDPMNSYTTGQMLVVDGGWSAGYGRNF
ncbi:MAG: SDR family oxidoreductase [Hyphomicrobiales bacterium]|nr:SDR family oxidoreductase [Hyphomicrobiales bacterium]